MPRLANYLAFAQDFVTCLPSFEDLKAHSEAFWNLLEVNTSRVVSTMGDLDSVENELSSMEVSELQLICLWVGLDAMQTKETLRSSLSEHFVHKSESPACQTIMLLNEFLSRKRTDAIETICRLLLPSEQFELVNLSNIHINAKRLCYAILVYVQNAHQLRLLMLFESAERAGYTRYVLVPKMETADKPTDDESADIAQEHIDVGADLVKLDIGHVNEFLEIFEARHGQQNSLCFDLFHDSANEVTLVFILRYLRESHIREVEGIVFADEAELVVLRLYNRIRTIDEHSSRRTGVEIANVIATELLSDPNIEYIEATNLTKQEDLENLIEALTYSEDDHLRLQELYLRLAPIEEAPKLVLRCDKSRDLSIPLEFLRKRDIDLLRDLNDIRNIGVTFIVRPAKGKAKSYIFKIFLEEANPGRYFLPYTAASVATGIRSRFEAYLRDNYNVQAVPGTR